MYGNSIDTFSNFINRKKKSKSPYVLNTYCDEVTSGKQNANSATKTGQTDLPVVLLFKNGTDVKINDTARSLGEIYSKMLRLFRRVVGSGNGQKIQVQYLDENRVLRFFSPEEACSECEKVAQIKSLNSKGVPLHAVMKVGDAKIILESEQFNKLLPPVKIITKCAVMVEMKDGTIAIINDYDRETGIFAGGDKPVTMNIEDAIMIVLSIVEEFDFKSLADKSRCIAAIITPALIMSGIGNFRSPIVFIEADESQSGKGFIVKIIAAAYNDIAYIINQQRSGVGSLEESLSERALEGRNFISIDNLTSNKKNDVFNSDKICSFMTEDTFTARVPHKGGISIDPSQHIIFITTNGCLLSKDLMNRSCPIAIKKRHNYKYKEYPEGSILDHIRHNTAKFQGAIFSIVQEWCKMGKPRTSTTAHDSSFTPWAQSLDWIVQNIMGLAPLLDGYPQVRDRITSPDLQKLRDIALAIVKYRNDESLTASDIVEEVGHEGVALPGMKTDCDFDKLTENDKDTVKKQLGALFARVFKKHGHGDVLVLNGIRITRKEMPTTYQSGTTKDIKYYIFSKQGDII